MMRPLPISLILITCAFVDASIAAGEESGRQGILADLQEQVAGQTELLVGLLLIAALVAITIYSTRFFKGPAPENPLPPRPVRQGRLGKVVRYPNNVGEREFPFGKEAVSIAAERAISTIEGVEIDHIDKANGHVVAETGGTVRSWGERIHVSVSEITPRHSRLTVTSECLTRLQFVKALLYPRSGMLVWAKHKENINRVFDTVAEYLGWTEPIRRGAKRQSSQAERIAELKGRLEQGKIDEAEFARRTADVLSEFEEDGS